MAWTQQAFDSFTDTNDTQLDAHTPDAGSVWADAADNFKISLNKLVHDAGPNGDASARNSTALANKQAAECIHLGGAGTITIIWLRLSGEGALANCSGYEFHFRAVNPWNYCEIYKTVAGVETLISSATVAPGVVSGDVCRAEADGSTLTLLINGTPVTTATDATFASGSVGTRYYQNSATEIDDFRAYHDLGVVSWRPGRRKRGHWSVSSPGTFF